MVVPHSTRTAPARAPARLTAEGCLLRGDWGAVHSLAIVNEKLADALDARGLAVERLQKLDGPSDSQAVGIAAHWPPRFEAPSRGPFVMYQPWEFGVVPASWVDPIRRRVDEVWTPSDYARQAYIAAGVAPELVHVVPNGVDLERFSPDGPARELPTGKGTIFLFVGGTTYRKGIDLLLEAYGRAFTAADDVCLAVKGVGANTSYRGQTAEEMIRQFRALPDAPELLFLDEDVPFEQVPDLFRAADVVVQAYRGEGFCLPALEALACGKPVIVTGAGPTDEFVTDACGWRVDSRRCLLPESLFEDDPLAGRGWVLEPELDALVPALREAADPAARTAKAGHARAQAALFTWANAAEHAAARIDALAGRAPIREVAPAEVPGRGRLLFAVDADWARSESWAPAVRAYADAFTPDDDTTLVLPAHDEAEAVALVTAELDDAGIDTAGLADIAIADASAVAPVALALAADAVISTDGRFPSRAAAVLPPEAAALRAVANA
jgi:glycosyltransferase involved in cell wall biosynthesis